MFSKSKRNAKKREAQIRRAAVTACESLEKRTLFAVALVTDTDGNLGVQVTGTAGNDNITITEDPDTQTFTVTGAGTQPTTPTGTEIRFFDISTFGGNDNVTFELASDYGNILDFSTPEAFIDVRSIHADLGSGNDSFTFDTDGNVIHGNSSINLDIEGMSGNDTITLDIDSVHSDSTLFAHLNGLDGNDRIDVDVDEVGGPGGAVDVDIYTGTGTNTVNIDQGVVNSGQSSAEYTIRGDAGTDSVTVDLLDRNDGFLEVNAFLGSGNDKLVTTFGANYDQTGLTLFNLNGGIGNDSLTVQSVDDFDIASPFGLDITMQGSSGNDSLVINLIGATGVNAGTFGADLSGNLKIRQAGEDGNDDITTRLRVNAGTTGGTVDVRVTGDAGNDRQRVTLVDEDAAASSGGTTYRGGSILFDGGAGVDTRDAFPALSGVPVTFLRFDAKV